MELQFGCLFMPRSLERTRAAAAAAEAAGFGWFGVGDSPAVFEDASLHLSEAARVTTRIALGPMVTHVVVRHPLVVATPHIGGLTPPAVTHQALETVAQLRTLLDGGMPVGAVNAAHATRLAALRKAA